MTWLAHLGEDLPERYYLGVDVGYQAHVAVVISLERFVQGGSAWKRAPGVEFASTQAGLQELQAYLQRFSAEPPDFLGLCEPTGGYYGATLYHYLVEHAYPMWLVDNGLTREMREKIFGHVPKTDAMDARVMARMGYLHEAVGEEFGLRPLELLATEDRELLILCRDSWKLKQLLNRARNQFTQLLAAVFPELKTFFTKSVSTVAPVTLIAHYPTPAELAAAPAEEVKAVLWEVGAYHHAKRVGELQRLARTSSGLLPGPSQAWRLAWLPEFLLHNFAAAKALRKRVVAVVTQREDYAWLATVPAATPATLGVILAATGAIERFANYRQYVAYTGYFPRVEQSQSIDRTRMSKRGNRDLKRTYFQIAATLVWLYPHQTPYRKLFEEKVAAGRPWYRAMPYVCAALARHIYHCLKYQEPYDLQQAFQVPEAAPASPQAKPPLEANLEGHFQVMEAQLDQEEE